MATAGTLAKCISSVVVFHHKTSCLGGTVKDKDDLLKSLLAYGHVSSGRFTTIGVEVLLTTTQ
jgi:hypothetical protein